MRERLFIALFSILTLTGCTSHPERSIRTKGIAIQPLCFNDAARLAFVQHELSGFYHCPVYILPPLEMPASFINLTKGQRYSADSILPWLSHQKNDSISILMGLTEKDIYTTEKDEHGRIKEPVSKYEVWGILGLGYRPGHASVVSDARFRHTDDNKYDHRLRTIVIHEIGHNMGLPHCPNPRCIMNDANEHISTVDDSGNDLCTSCRNKLAELIK